MNQLDLTTILTPINVCVYLDLTKKIFKSNHRKYFRYLKGMLLNFLEYYI
jgi:hypothetical protein